MEITYIVKGHAQFAIQCTDGVRTLELDGKKFQLITEASWLALCEHLSDIDSGSDPSLQFVTYDALGIDPQDCLTAEFNPTDYV